MHTTVIRLINKKVVNLALYRLYLIKLWFDKANEKKDSCITYKDFLWEKEGMGQKNYFVCQQ